MSVLRGWGPVTDERVIRDGREIDRRDHVVSRTLSRQLAIALGRLRCTPYATSVLPLSHKEYSSPYHKTIYLEIFRYTTSGGT